MTDINTPIRDGRSPKAARPLSMISILAISVGMAAAPAQAQDMATSDMLVSAAPVQAAPILAPQPVPAERPTIAVPAATTEPAPATGPAPTVSEARADDLARKGGFDAATVAPEALAQIAREQQAREDAVAAAKLADTAQPAPANAVTARGPMTDSAALATPAFDADVPAALAEGDADPVAVSSMIEPVPESTAATAAISADGKADWSLLAMLAAMLGIGSAGAGAYAATRRRKGVTRQSAALKAAIMPELRREPALTETRPAIEKAPVPARLTEEARLNAKIELAEFVAGLPAFDAPPAGADRKVKLGQRRVAAAPKPYLREADLARPAGYFTARVDALPTPQNPFLTRPKRLKRARHLDRKLAERKVAASESRDSIVGKVHVSRRLEPAFA